jgi:UDP-2-acetamido-3-amino-2,3-dideoxy-glucuronate N-acetyltransferase
MEQAPSYLAHPSAIIDDGVLIGKNTKIWHFCHVATGAVIGENCSLGQNVYVAPRARLGNNVRIQNNVSVYDEVILEDDVFCGPSAVFTNVINPRAHISRKNEYKTTLAKKGATIGANATIICGVTLHEFCFVAAGAVVTKDVRAYELVGGVPAKHMGWICSCGNSLESNSQGNEEFMRCLSCKTEYALKSGAIIPV